MDIDKNVSTVSNRSQRPIQRMVTVVIPAGAVTLALFSAMQHLIKTDDFEAPKLVVYDVEPLMEKEVVIESPPERRPITKIAAVDPPPQTPQLVNEIENPKGDFAGYTGAAPAEYVPGQMGPLLTKRVAAIAKQDLIPITPPVPTYPTIALQRGLEGSCDVHMNVSIRGEPFDIHADCTDRVFERAAKKAVAKVKFAPQIRDGLPVMVTGVIYPLEFQIKQ